MRTHTRMCPGPPPRCPSSKTHTSKTHIDAWDITSPQLPRTEHDHLLISGCPITKLSFTNAQVSILEVIIEALVELFTRQLLASAASASCAAAAAATTASPRPAPRSAPRRDESPATKPSPAQQMAISAQPGSKPRRVKVLARRKGGPSLAVH